MSILRKILMFKAVIVVLLHTVIPHQHHGEMTSSEHISAHNNANTIFEIIGIAFHGSQSNGFDNYTLPDPGTPNQIDKFSTTHFINSPRIDFDFIVENWSQSPTTQVNIPTHAFNIQSNGLRGPPIHDIFS